MLLEVNYCGCANRCLHSFDNVSLKSGILDDNVMVVF